MLKRSLTTIIGLPLVLLLIVFGNKYIVDVIVAILAILGMHEYLKCVGHKFRPVSWIGYISAISIAFIHVIPSEYLLKYLGIAILSIVSILFMHVVFSDMKINFADIAMTLFGIVYIVGFMSFISLIYGIEKNGNNIGKYYIGLLLLVTWGSDIIAYLVGVNFGKITFSKISPNKHIEACVAGAISAVILVVLASVIFNNVFGLNINYGWIALIALITTILGQIGDFSASCIKRYMEVKDFSNLIPGHGGIIDRFDSVIFAAPFMYYLLMFLI